MGIRQKRQIKNHAKLTSYTVVLKSMPYYQAIFFIIPRTNVVGDLCWEDVDMTS